MGDYDYTVPIETTRADRDPLRAVSASGPWITVDGGRRLLDFHSQYMCTGVGHAHPRVVAALHAAVDGVDYVSEVMAHDTRSEAARLLTQETVGTGRPWGACRFVSSGSEAVEMAILIARTVTQRPRIVVAQSSYHGWTSSAAAATSLPHLRNLFRDAATGIHYSVPTDQPPFVAAPTPHPQAGPGEIAECLEQTERLIRAVGVDQVAAFMLEIYKGAGGHLVPDAYVRGIREMTQRLGILWIDDEAIAGAGRTGAWWAYQHVGVEPDLLVTAKGISSSAVPTGAVLLSPEIAHRLDNGVWFSVSTNSGHPLAMAAVRATIETVRDEDVLANVTELGQHVADRLADMAERHATMAYASGRGFGWGIELTRLDGTPFVPTDRWFTPSVDPAPSFDPALFLAERCLERDVLLYTFIPNTLTIAPPLVSTRSEVDFGLDALDAALGELDAHATAG
jgi:taurine--2-oxoglutarate transaminase